ncbi:two-component system response regulator [Clostridia bacterium]|nr:two-component system response regulator [Clostridia bacterium]
MIPAARNRILIVDDNISNLKVGKNALAADYDVFTAPSAEKMLHFLSNPKNMVDLILLDVNMPEMDGYEAIKILKETPLTANIPVIFLTAQADTESELAGLDLGAVDYISKPFLPPLLLKRINLHITLDLQRRQLEEQQKLLMSHNLQLRTEVDDYHDAFLSTVAELVEGRDGSTGAHIQRTQLYLEILVTKMLETGVYYEEVSTWDLPLLYQSSQLHDVGKISVSDNILRKPGRLTEEEFDEIKKHTTFGGEIIDRISARIEHNDFLEYAKTFALTHQEKWDGTGYPSGLSGKEIPLKGRVMAISDVYDALVSARPYKDAFTHENAVGIIKDGKGSHFDPALVDVFVLVEKDFHAISLKYR